MQLLKDFRSQQKDRVCRVRTFKQLLRLHFPTATKDEMARWLDWVASVEAAEREEAALAQAREQVDQGVIRRQTRLPLASMYPWAIGPVVTAVGKATSDGIRRAMASLIWHPSRGIPNMAYQGAPLTWHTKGHP